MHDKYMKNMVFILLNLTIFSFAGSALAAPHYVMPTNGAAESPFETWAKAATNIQDAVNVATNGETVWVSNGTYYCQGVYTSIYSYWGNIITNTAMVMITNSITVQGVNGYSNTIVDGNYPLWTTAVFHVSSDSAILSGLTITNGFATTNLLNAGGVRTAGVGIYFKGSLVTNCLITGNILSNTIGGQSFHVGPAICVDSGTVSHCIIRGNKAIGSLVYGSGLFANQGGTAAKPIIIKNCDVSYNQSDTSFSPLRLFYCGSVTAIYCNVHDNNNAGIDISGGGSVVDSCTISNNSIGLYFVTESSSTARNCLISSNSTYGVKFAYNCKNSKIENCMVVNNANGVFFDSSPGYWFVTLNCIIYYNTTANWIHGGTNMSYTNCCTYPMPTNVPGISIGAGNITNAPVFVNTNSGNYRLSTDSPCVNTGINQNWMTNRADFDGNPRIRYGTVDMGAYEVIYNGTIYKF